MNDMIKVKDNREERITEYKELLCRRDQLEKEAGSILISYTREFGEEIARNFELKVECIKKKKMIAYCQKQINRGRSIDVNTMNGMIENEMQMYYLELKEMAAKNAAAKNATTSSEIRIQRSKKVYRRLAKMLHPDVNMKTMIDPALRDLWERIADAYRMNDCEAIEDLEVLVRNRMEALGDEGFEIAFADIEERIERVEQQINEIISTEPYTYLELLTDDKHKAAKHKELEKEYKEFGKYRKELEDALDKLISSGGVGITWLMN
ncbi:MAG: J domain-containing protein [Lachnospiraceae bacterium]|nr:J domain-containing protein [Lachnospiraceae bacterium]